jgi:hypothetical protein
MAYIHPDVLDQGLDLLDTATTVMHICSAEPATRTEAVTTFGLGNKTSLSIASPVDASPGRKVVVAAFADGSVTATGTATHWAIVDGTRLLAASTLSASQVVTTGNVFTLDAIDITMPGV